MSDVAAALVETVQIGFQGAPEQVSPFGKARRLGGNDFVNAAPRLGKLFDVVIQRFRQDSAAFGKALGIMCGGLRHGAVNVVAGKAILSRSA